MQDRMPSVSMAPHPKDFVHQDTPSQENERLRRVVAAQIGPRRPGTIYDNTTGTYKVVAVITELTEARRILKRRAAQFAITILDLHTGTTSTVGTVWTGSDRVLKAVAL